LVALKIIKYRRVLSRTLVCNCLQITNQWN